MPVDSPSPSHDEYPKYPEMLQSGGRLERSNRSSLDPFELKQHDVSRIKTRSPFWRLPGVPVPFAGSGTYQATLQPCLQPPAVYAVLLGRSHSSWRGRQLQRGPM